MLIWQLSLSSEPFLAGNLALTGQLWCLLMLFGPHGAPGRHAERIAELPHSEDF